MSVQELNRICRDSRDFLSRVRLVLRLLVPEMGFLVSSSFT